jgi:hypothetical protein
MALGFGLASFYLIPAIYEQRWVQISAALYAGLMPADNFLYAKTSDAEHDAFNRIASHIAVLLIFWSICAVLVAWRRSSRQTAGNLQSDHFVSMAALSLCAIALMFPITVILWRFLPELRFVQFPWRWMSILALCAMTFIASSARGRMRWVWLLSAAFAVTASAHYLVKHAWWDTEDMPTLQGAIKDGTGFEGADEYDPAGDDHADLPQKQPRAILLATPDDAEARANARVVVEKWSAEHRSIHVVTQKSAHVALRLVNYPAWRVTLNGKRASVQHPEATGQIIVAVPAGESELRIDFTRTPDRTLGGCISVVSLITSSILYWRRRSPPVAKA